jgi:hypothetical protein
MESADAVRLSPRVARHRRPDIGSQSKSILRHTSLLAALRAG